MYYVNRNQIETILAQIPDITAGLRTVAASWDGTTLTGLIQERSLHLAIEVVTDVGSCLIDGFIMRDAGSYEDIISIIHEEKVLGQSEIYERLIELVALRKPLVQDYYAWREVICIHLPPFFRKCLSSLPLRYGNIWTRSLEPVYRYNSIG